MTPRLFPPRRRWCGGSSRPYRRNRESSLTEPVTNAVPLGATIDVRLTVTVCVVPMPQGRATELERIFTPMHKQMADNLPPPEI